MVCPNCGKVSKDDARFCSECGERLAVAEPKNTGNTAENLQNVQDIKVQNSDSKTTGDVKTIYVEMKKRTPVFLWIGITAVFIICAVLITIFVNAKGFKEASYEEKMDLGRKYLFELDYDQAIIAFEEAIKIDPKKKDAYLELADAYVKNGKPEKAAEVLGDALDEIEDKEDKELIEKHKKKIEEDKTDVSTPEPMDKATPEPTKQDETASPTPLSTSSPTPVPTATPTPSPTPTLFPVEDSDDEMFPSEEEIVKPVIVSAMGYGEITKEEKILYCTKCGAEIFSSHKENFTLNKDYSDYTEKINRLLREEGELYIYSGDVDYSDGECGYHNAEYFDEFYDNLYIDDVNILNGRYLIVNYSYEHYDYDYGFDGVSYQRVFDLETGMKVNLCDFFYGTETEFKKLLAEKNKENYDKKRYLYGISITAEEVYNEAYEITSLKTSGVEIYEDKIIMSYDHYFGSDGVIEIEISFEEFFGDPHEEYYRIGKISNIQGNGNVPIYSGASAESEVLGQFAPNYEVLVTGREKINGSIWYKVETDAFNDIITGYISDKNIIIEKEKSEEYNMDMEYYKIILYGRDEYDGILDEYNLYPDTKFGLKDLNNDGRKELIISGIERWTKADRSIIVYPYLDEYKREYLFGSVYYVSENGFLVSQDSYRYCNEDVYVLTTDGNMMTEYSFWILLDRDPETVEYFERDRLCYKVINGENIDISEDEFRKLLDDDKLSEETAENFLTYHDLTDNNIRKYVR